MLTTFLLLSLLLVGLALSAWRRLDHWADRDAMNRLASMQPARPACFDPAMIADLPGPGVGREWVDTDCARLTVRHQGLLQSVNVTAAPDGQPNQVRFERWSNANPEKQHRLQPFGAYLSEFRSFGGFRLPAHMEAGNHFGTGHYFPFFVAHVTDVEFPHD